MDSQGKKYRIFLSYRGKSVGEAEGELFEDRFYDFLKKDPAWKEKYGEIYFSPKTERMGNFWMSVPTIMQNVEYFVMPLTPEYFNDFWDETNDCPDNNSVTYREINYAITNNCKFICIAFPGFTDNMSLYRRLFGNNYKMISAAKKINYDVGHETEIMREIADYMTCSNFSTRGAQELLKNIVPNVYLGFKSETENKEKYPFYQKLYDVKKITLLNFAASSFISGVEIASFYEESDFLTRWFRHQLIEGKVEANIVITDPYSMAAKDAADYKMYPKNLKDNMPKDQIILYNLKKLFEFMKEFPTTNLKVYLTKISLPYGIIITEHHNTNNNHMKVDLYPAVTNNDERRPSFYLLKNNQETKALYDFFEGNVLNIMNNYAKRFNGHPDISWLLNRNKHIIHRGVIKQNLLPHTMRAYEACLDAKYPIEVDLLQLADGTIIVGRDDQNISQYGYNQLLSSYKMSDLRNINKLAGQDKIMMMSEFLNLISGKVPILLEIKVDPKDPFEKIQHYVRRIVIEVQRYIKMFANYFGDTYHTEGYGIAIHSANPCVLKMVKEFDCMIPCGIISTDFSSKKDVMDEGFFKLHKDAGYMNIVNPDFISYDVNYLNNSIARKICDEESIPLLVWTIKDVEDQMAAIDSCCDNMIIEGAKSYI